MSSPTATHAATVDYQEVQSRPEFQELKRTHRSFVFPMAVVFLAWYLAYVLLAAFAPQIMAIPVLGNINLGIVLGLAQFLTTFLITAAYVSFSTKALDPKSSAIRHELEAAGVGLPDETPTAADKSEPTPTTPAGGASR
ncbi:DUF485 domain-containing protein [Nesterenkonia sp. CL21]|uniref:DUF485 domain-containing protein n=1 Tax=Nesterenkonia sp. CL21 TaxID=3064894 RepID=UPI00287AE95E|nr:DUF485 domain-containing protein [Nesterenkonia sp. CL21]MDS2171284.1 DUF485 domain-containing protein [Nesterenkonia sp. CL21]